MSACLRCASPLSPEARYCPQCGASVRALSEAGSADGMLIDGRYRILGRIGAGGSGTVYLAQHIHLGKKVAIKAMHQDLLADALALERFRREATMVGELTNPHIVQVLDYGRLADGRVYLAMEHLEGESLQAMLARLGRVSIDQAIDVLLQACEALGEAHSLGYVHRDLRPKNLFLARRATESNFLKVLDFGLAKAVGLTQLAANTTLGLTFGDPRYMSPEQAKGLAVDQRSDLYQLGCVAYEMLTGAPPFHGAGVFEVLAKHATETPAPLAVHRPDVPGPLAACVARLLAKSPDERFATASQLAGALRACASEEAAVSAAPAISAVSAASAAGAAVAARPPVAARAADTSATPAAVALGTSQAWYRAGDELAIDPSASASASTGDAASSISRYLQLGARRQRRLLLVSLFGSASIAAALVLWFVGRDKQPSPAPPSASEPPVAQPYVPAPAPVADAGADAMAASAASAIIANPTPNPPAVPRSAATPNKPNKPTLPTSPTIPTAAITTPAPSAAPASYDLTGELARAQVELATGDLDAAEQRLQAAVAAAPRSAAAHAMLGETQLARGAFAAAADSFKSALLIDPDNARARRGYVTAEARLEPAIDEEPDVEAPPAAPPAELPAPPAPSTPTPPQATDPASPPPSGT